jgi:hypothetical protein
MRAVLASAQSAVARRGRKHGKQASPRLEATAARVQTEQLGGARRRRTSARDASAQRGREGADRHGFPVPRHHAQQAERTRGDGGVAGAVVSAIAPSARD